MTVARRRNKRNRMTLVRGEERKSSRRWNQPYSPPLLQDSEAVSRLANDEMTELVEIRGLSPHGLKPLTVKRSWLTSPGFEDLTGRRFGTLLVVGKEAERGASGHARWVCRCSCGSWVRRRRSALVNEAEPSCGTCQRGRMFDKETKFVRTVCAVCPNEAITIIRIERDNEDNELGLLVTAGWTRVELFRVRPEEKKSRAWLCSICAERLEGQLGLV